MISGLPESTLRYYEQIGIIAPITRDPSSGHRAYSDADLERLTTVSCLAATGMPLESMRTYLANSQGGAHHGDVVGRLRGNADQVQDGEGRIFDDGLRGRDPHVLAQYGQPVPLVVA